jgi:hypothetical protein
MMEKYQLYITIALLLFTLMPIMYLGARIATKVGRGEFVERPLLAIYALIAPLYFYCFWFAPEILHDYFHMPVFWQVAVYAVLCFAVILKTDPPE